MQTESPAIFLLIISLSSVTNMAVFLYFLSAYRAVTSSPGRIPRVSPWIHVDEKDRLKVSESKKSGGIRYCRWCKCLKPDRAHHCRVCDQCTLKMDHHCPWLDNCIGFGNHKYFLLTLFYAALSLLLMTASSGWLGYYLMHSTSLLGVDLGRLIIGITMSIVCGFVGILITIFF